MLPRFARPVAQKIDGRKVAGEIKERLRLDIQRINAVKPNFTPGLSIVQVGDRSDSNVYIRNKLSAAKKVGITASHVRLPRTSTETEIIDAVNQLNEDPAVNGVIVQLPLDCDSPVSTDRVINSVSPQKDMDGLTSHNAGRLARGELAGTVLPCTPRGLLKLVEYYESDIAGKEVVVLGRSKIVGSPAAELFLWNNATITVCHSKTQDLPAICRRADILVVAIGQAHMVRGTWIKPGATVIDCGINILTTGKLVGDVLYEEAQHVAGKITPVPGGVGPMTVAMLLENTFDQAVRDLEAAGKDVER